MNYSRKATSFQDNMAIPILAIISRFSILMFSMLFNYLKWVLEFLLYHPFYSLRRLLHHHQPLQQFQILTEEEEQVEIWHPRGEEEVDCAVCLNRIGEGDGVRVLRCEHVFHRECLNRWVALRNFTCPLCRDFLGSAGIRSVHGEGSGEARVLFFKFSSFSDNNSERDNWWLR